MYMPFWPTTVTTQLFPPGPSKFPKYGRQGNSSNITCELTTLANYQAPSQTH